MTLFRLDLPAGDYEGRILADCDTVRLNIPGVGAVQVPVDAVAEVPPSRPEEPEDGTDWLAGQAVFSRRDHWTESVGDRHWYSTLGDNSRYWPCTWKDVLAYASERGAFRRLTRLIPDFEWELAEVAARDARRTNHNTEGSRS